MMESASEIAKLDLLSPECRYTIIALAGLEFRVNGRDMEHMHSDELADMLIAATIASRLFSFEIRPL